MQLSYLLERENGLDAVQVSFYRVLYVYSFVHFYYHGLNCVCTYIMHTNIIIIMPALLLMKEDLLLDDMFLTISVE